MKPLNRMTAIGCALAVLAASCGGDADTATTTRPTSSTQETTAATIADGTSAPVETTTVEESQETTEDPTSEVAAESLVTVTIGEESWEFRPTGFLTERCDTDFFGGYWVLFSTGVGLLLSGKNWTELGVDQTPNIQIKIEDAGLEWVADPETTLPGVEPGMSQIDSFAIDGSRASGTATFVEANAAYSGTVEPVTGTFEAVCAAEQ